MAERERERQDLYTNRKELQELSFSHVRQFRDFMNSCLVNYESIPKDPQAMEHALNTSVIYSRI
jgi:hypothetical protein